MILITGGMYQGKLEYAQKRFKISGKDIFHCDETISGRPKGLICNEIDKWILALLKDGSDVEAAVRRYVNEKPEIIIICNDISCGIVPVDPLMRAWRESVGRTMIILAQEAQEVIRLFCGIATTIKKQDDHVKKINRRKHQ